eukprot:gnl/Spiro4/22673_TR11186_c0_g1_i1.p1 gnl/Spiro4/22673_TR11186_c0_g1~~gnl/Spiro4/22673_TR11186_c0_g1_i1.p1  ORF type:complete len:609 (-),score=194.19 gnl/Spiro4/22673_TR11186_c0_g1_i1:531-2357(-)
MLLARANNMFSRTWARRLFSPSISPALAQVRGIAANTTSSSMLPAPLAAISSNLFNLETMRRECAPDVFAAFQECQRTGTPMPKDLANQLANTLQYWAMSRGAVVFSHWFSPLRGSNAEKYDSFIDLNYTTGSILVDFSGSKLFGGETDGSSFPHGGLRATHAAGAYTAWDTTSPPFVLNDTLYIPASFIAWTGQALDERTPLLRSQDAVNEYGVRLLRALGDKKVQRVDSKVGWEQEFFVIDKNNFLARPDLRQTGRSLIGALPSLGQQTEFYYFNAVPQRVRTFMRDVQQQMWRVGIPINTMHNEVAPAQHEISPIFSVVNIAMDQNILAQKILRETAEKHDLAVLFHEKPFAGLNGSGKHNNWGLNTDTGVNLFVPGKSPADQSRFMAFVAVLVRGLDMHGDLLRCSVATANNDHRLGAQEAPPAIISLSTGRNLEEHIKRVVAGDDLPGYSSASYSTLEFGTNAVPSLMRPREDRNRTAPFPFCGNRWEFRAVGSSQNIALPLMILNTIVADSMLALAKDLENGRPLRDAVANLFKQHQRVIFNGNGYSPEWHAEAARRGLPNLQNSVDATATFASDKNKQLFASMKVLGPEEVDARQTILFET